MRTRKRRGLKGYVIEGRRTFDLGKGLRISDGGVPEGRVGLIEAKLVKYQSLDKQLQDAIAGAKELYGENAVVHLVVAPHTKVASTIHGCDDIVVHTLSEEVLASARQEILGSDVVI